MTTDEREPARAGTVLTGDPGLPARGAAGKTGHPRAPATALVAGTLAFLFASAVPRAVLTAALMSGRAPNPPRPDPTGDLFLALYLLVLSSVLATAGFLLVTAFDPRWRSLPWRRAALIAGGLGLAAPVARFLMLAAAGVLVLSLLRLSPSLGTGLLYGLPGVLLGVIAILVARRLCPANPQRPR